MKWADDAAREVWTPLVGEVWAEARVRIQQRMLRAAFVLIGSLVLMMMLIALLPLAPGVTAASLVGVAAVGLWTHASLGLLRLGREITSDLRSRGIAADSTAPVQNAWSFRKWQNRNGLSHAELDPTH